MTHRERVRDFWDDVVNNFLDGGSPDYEPLSRWQAAYDGGGAGVVDLEAFPEPYGGPLVGDVKAVMFGLNPGISYPAYQHREGVLAREIRATGRYSEVFKTAPVNREPWLTDIGPVGYLLNRVAFMRRWLGDDSLNDGHLLTFELYPWHSRRVTGIMRPPPDIIESMVFQPIHEMGIRHVFAFGAPWFRLLDDLGLRRLVTLGSGGEPYGSKVPSRSVAVYRRQDYFVVVEKHAGSAGPPSADETLVLRSALADRGFV